MDTGTLTVGQLAQGIDTALSGWFGGELWVQGEIESLRRSNNGHVYFHLVERDDQHGSPAASVDVTLFDAARRHVNAQLKQAGGARMTDGMQVRIRGRLEYYAPQGRVQLRMSGIDPAFTLALLVTERDRVVALLEADQLLERNRSIPVPVLPLRVGLITSDGSAAMRDVVHELEASGFAWRVSLANVAVQGRGAATMIARAIDALVAAPVDIVVLVRGGGSRLDLATFDSEVVARAVATSSVPVWTGIGHEIDTSVADVVAHSCFKTPTACAAALARHVQDWLDAVDHTWHRIPAMVARHLARSERLLAVQADAVPRLAASRVAAADQHLVTRARRMHGAAGHQVKANDHELEMLSGRVVQLSNGALRHAEQQLLVDEARVDAVDPVRLLQRGWSITRNDAGSVVRDVSVLEPGDRLVTTVANGVIESDVGRTTPSGDVEREHDG